MLALWAVTAYWAKSTKDDLKANDDRIEGKLTAEINEVKTEAKETNRLLHNIDKNLTVMDAGLTIYKSEKHDVVSERDSYKSAVTELGRALNIAERIIDKYEKK